MENQVEVVQSSFSRVFAKKAELTSRFYHYLFQARPETASMFTGNSGHQKEMFSSMLAVVARDLAQPKLFNFRAENLRLKHAPLLINRDQWQAAKGALTLAFSEVLKDDLSKEEDQAWAAAATKLIDAMAASDD
jgi:hemoglobin-like flavoprotein